ncbi:hypothetical protein [Vibrio intestinalis]|uniref:hypothetical protein n=1 Tax=Vibrio intestinalis TaxID=2933291 RepID=UPI0021A8755B|nr:hypothetical protein [Vibrio intestinalis]
MKTGTYNKTVVTMSWFKVGSLASLAFLFGCSEPEPLALQTQVGKTVNYYAQFEVEFDTFSSYQEELPMGEISFHTPISIRIKSNNELGTTLSVKAHEIDFTTLDFRQYDAIHELVEGGVELSKAETADFSFGFSAEQKALANNKELFADFAALASLQDSAAIHSLAVFPPQLLKQVGAETSKTYANGFVTHYSVTLVSEHRVRVQMNGSVPKPQSTQEMTEEERYLDEIEVKESIQGWADYHPDTGELIQLKAAVSLPIGKESSVKAMVLVSDNPLSQPIEDINAYSYGRGQTDKQHRLMVEQLSTQARLSSKPTVFLSKENERPDALEISAIQQGAVAPMLKNYALLDLNGKPMDKQFMVYHYSDSGIFGDKYPEDSTEHQYSGLISPDAPRPAFIEVDYVPENYTKHLESLPIKEGKVSFSHPQFTLEGSQMARKRGWEFTLTEQKGADIGFYSLFDKDNDAHVYNLDEMFDEPEAHRYPKGWSIALADKNTYQIQVSYDEVPSGHIAFAWYEQPKQQSTRIPLWYAVENLKAQAPTHDFFNNRAVTEQYEKPVVEILKHQLVASMPRYMVALCEMDNQPKGDYRGSAYQWREQPSRYLDKPYQYFLSAFNQSVWHFYDAHVDAKLMCSEATLSVLEKETDYRQPNPWMIELTGKYSHFTWQQVMKELQAYNDKGEVIQWVTPGDKADYSVPYVKAWGNIASVKLIQRREPKVEFEQSVQFGPMPE